MPRKIPDLQLIELTGATFPDLESAQMAARSIIAHDLATTLRGLLAIGVLVVRDGKIYPNPRR
ncbi:MAG: hypothetical protein DDG60_00745 [Anaerolineae bacterium]|nr:MAG: hypothetical protein DDG60_00745 [Anaerolineae bacterium]